MCLLIQEHDTALQAGDGSDRFRGLPDGVTDGRRIEIFPVLCRGPAFGSYMKVEMGFELVDFANNNVIDAAAAMFEWQFVMVFLTCLLLVVVVMHLYKSDERHISIRFFMFQEMMDEHRQF